MKNLTLFFLFGILLVSCKNSDSNPLEFSAISDSKINLTNSLQTKKGFSSNETSNNTALKESISRKLLKNGNVVFETADLEKMKLNIENLVQKKVDLSNIAILFRVSAPYLSINHFFTSVGNVILGKKLFTLCLSFFLFDF